MQLALRLIRAAPQDRLSIDSKLLLVADALKRGDSAQAKQLLGKAGAGADLSFWVPLIESWNAAERRDDVAALAILARVPRNSAFAPFVDEQAHLILLKLKKDRRGRALRSPRDRQGRREGISREACARRRICSGGRSRPGRWRWSRESPETRRRSGMRSAPELSTRLQSTQLQRPFPSSWYALALEMRRSPGGRGRR
jgi:hypothetical protein